MCGYTANFNLGPYSVSSHDQQDSNVFGYAQKYLRILQTVEVPQVQQRQCFLKQISSKMEPRPIICVYYGSTYDNILKMILL